MDKKALIAVVASAILAGLGGIFIKHLDMEPTSISWLRMSFPTVVMGGWLIITGTPFFRGNYKKMLWASLLNTLRMYFFIVAFVYTSIGNAVILFYTYPIFTAILGIIVLKERISRRQGLLLILAFVGLMVSYSDKTFSFGDNDFIGMIAALLSSVTYATTVILFKSETHYYSRNELIFYQNFLGIFVFLPFFIIDFPNISTPDIGIGFSYGLVIGIIAFSLFFYGLKYLKAATATALMYIEVVSAIVLSYIWMGDRLSLTMIIGGGMIILSSFLISTKKKDLPK